MYPLSRVIHFRPLSKKLPSVFPLNYPFSLSPPSLVIFPSLFHSPFLRSNEREKTDRVQQKFSLCEEKEIEERGNTKVGVNGVLSAMRVDGNPEESH